MFYTSDYFVLERYYGHHVQDTGPEFSFHEYCSPVEGGESENDYTFKWLIGTITTGCSSDIIQHFPLSHFHISIRTTSKQAEQLNLLHLTAE